MQSRKSDNKKITGNLEGKINNAVNVVSDDSQNKNHNSKKVGMGPNTNR